MKYQTFPPPTDLSNVVEHFWAVENPLSLDAHREILIPNGRPMLLICIGEPGVRISGDCIRTPNISNLAGPNTTPIILEQSGVSNYVAAQLQPWGLAMIGMPVLVNTAVPLAAIYGGRMADAVAAACRKEAFGLNRTMPLVNFLRRQRRSIAKDRLDIVQAAIELVDAQAGQMEVERLTATLHISYDQLYRHFKSMLGLAPKQYSSIMRFYSFTSELLANDADGLARIATLQGYYDQAHAAREFKRYTGVSQRRFRETLNGIAKLMQARGEPPDSYNK